RRNKVWTTRGGSLLGSSMLALAACSSASSDESAEHVRATRAEIQGGSLDAFDAPAGVLWAQRNGATGEENYCGAVLISPDVVLSAPLCTSATLPPYAYWFCTGAGSAATSSDRGMPKGMNCIEVDQVAAADAADSDAPILFHLSQPITNITPAIVSA